MDRLRRLKRHWLIGAGACIILALSALGFGLLALVILALVQLGAGALGFPLLAGWDIMDLLAVSAFVWFPLSVGVMLPEVLHAFAPMLRENEESKRKAELAPYLRDGSGA